MSFDRAIKVETTNPDGDEAIRTIWLNPNEEDSSRC